MKRHLWNKSKSARPPRDARNVRTWCGREVPPHRATVNRSEVSCRKCDAAFDRVLRSLSPW